jgi:diguanylate cyclase (GGDEF)-like protein
VLTAVVLWAGPLRRDTVERITDQRGPLYVTVGIIIAIALLSYGRLRQSRRDEQLALRTAELTTEAAEARASAAELAALIRFSQALSFCTDGETLRRTVLEELPRLIGHQHFWVRTRPSNFDLVIAPESAADAFPAGPEAWETFPLMAGDKDVGVLGVRQDPGPLTESQRRTLELSALILAVSVRNVQQFKRISDFSMFDPLTACLTKPQGLEMFAAEIRRAQRTNTALSVLLLEVDHLERVIDRHGQAVGDQVLAQLGGFFKRELRSSDVRCRSGGALFAFMLPDTGLEGAVRAANDLRQKISELVVTAEGERIPVTVSIGVADLLPGDIGPVNCLRRAEAALIKAIYEGRNRVGTETPSSAPTPGSDLLAR